MFLFMFFFSVQVVEKKNADNKYEKEAYLDSFSFVRVAEKKSTDNKDEKEVKLASFLYLSSVFVDIL